MITVIILHFFQSDPLLVESEADLRKELETAKEEIEIWRKRYTDLLHSKGYPLTEKTGRNIINLLNDLGNIR